MSATKEIAKLTELLKTCRVRRGLSLRDLSNASGVHPTTISLLERGRAKPSKKAITELVKALALSDDEQNQLFGMLLQLPEFQIVKDFKHNRAIASGFALTMAALLTGIPANEVKLSWIFRDLPDDYNIIMLTEKKEFFALKVGSDNAIFIARAPSFEELPPVSEASRLEVTKKPATS